MSMLQHYSRSQSPGGNGLRPHSIEGTNLNVYNNGTGQGRILIFEYSGQTDMIIRRVPGTNIILIGERAAAELAQLLKTHGRPAVSKLIPGGIAGKAFPLLREFLGVTERSNRQPQS